MKSLISKIIIALSVIIIHVHSSYAGISIDSVSTISSSCSNNGSATVYANSVPASALLYAIVAGPILSSIQNSNTFSSLYPGIYTARVYDVNFDSAETQFQVGGNYQLPSFTVTGINPTCQGFTDGSVTAIVDTNFGLSPFIYQMIVPTIGAVQSQNYFQGLTDNTYEIRMTDACGNYQTRTSVLINSGTGLATAQNTLFISLSKTGCDTMEMTSYIYLYKEKGNLPLTMTLNTSSGSITKQIYPIVVDTINLHPGLYKIIDTIPNITYGDNLQMILTDVCGATVQSYFSQVAPYDWELLYYATTINCVATFTAVLQLKQPPNYPYHNTIAMAPSSFTLIDLNTNMLVDSMTCSTYCSLYLHAETPGTLYQLTITDGCGEVWQQNIMWPTQGAPLVNVYNSYGCIDSTTALFFECLGFQSAPTVHFFSGPTAAHSTKPHFAYNDNISYPRDFSSLYGSSYINIKDCPAGTYVFEVSDSCGNVVQGSLTVDSTMLTHLSYSWYVKPSCLNNNTLFYNFEEGTPIAVYASITGIGNNFYLNPALNQAVDSITTMSTGQYAIEIYYAVHNGSGIGYDGSMIDNAHSCWVVYDTIVITPYTNSSFLSNTTIYCNGTNYVQLIPDTSRGVPPYQFAIINGPQTFPLQDSSFFQIQQFGNYLISMEDACGNNYTQQITVTSDSFPPIIKVGFFCEGNNAALSAVSSAYFSYIWQYPNGNTVTGDSITFHPFTVADTGWYHVLKIVNINGCNDTLKTDYYLSSGDSIVQNLSICYGDSVMVGSNIYYLPGTYRDTLVSAHGCDSLVITTFAYIPFIIDSNAVSICNGDSLNVGTNYYLAAGTYIDTIPVAGACKKIVVTQLSLITIINNISVSICNGDSIMIGTIVHNQAGIYNDTLVSYTGCDSVVVTTLSMNLSPVFNITSNTDSIEAGTSVQLICDNTQSSIYYWYGNVTFSSANSPTTLAFVDSTQWIYLSVTGSNGCTAIDSILIFVKETVSDTCDTSANFIIPNVFTPNDDGINDYFSIEAKNTELDYFKILNRWGEEVFNSNEIEFKWDGRNRGKKCMNGVYFYIMQFTNCSDERKKYKQGSITLLY